MSTSIRSFLSAGLALVFVVLLTAPLNGGVYEDYAASVAGDVVLPDAIASDRTDGQAPFIKPQIAEPVVAERGFDEADEAYLISPRYTPIPLTEGDDPQIRAHEPDARRALLRVYRL